MNDSPLPVAVLHLDESCLGNGRVGDNPGGTAGLVESRTKQGVQRREFYVASRATTNNRMALFGAITSLKLLGAKGNRVRALLVSDSEYLVRGVREWAPGWQARGWTRKGGVIENLALWQELWSLLPSHEAQFVWVRGHAGHPKNEFANDLAVRAATEQITSDGMIEASFADWLAAPRNAKRYAGYDADAAFLALETRLNAGELFPRVETA